MKVIKTASGRTLKISKKEWEEMGKDAGWVKRSGEEEIAEETAPTPIPETLDTPKPMGWNPNAIKEENLNDQTEEKNEEDIWKDVEVKFETKVTNYGPLTFVILSNTAQPLAPKLKEMGYKPFNNRVTGEWTWSKIVNKYKSEELDPQKVSAVKFELDELGVETSALNATPVETGKSQDTRETAEDINLDESEIPEEIIRWHNEMEAAQKLAPNERKKKYSDIIFGALERVGEEAEKDATSEKSQEIIKTLLESAANFHNYSFWNSMMIAFIKPGAQYVASQSNWQLMGRVPKKGAKKIPIMFPLKGKQLSDEEKAEMSDQEIRNKTRTRFGLGSAIAYEDTQPISEDWVSKRGKFKGQGPFEPPVWQIDSQEATPWLNQLYAATYKWATESKKFKIDIEGMGIAGGYATIGGKIAINDKSDGLVKVSTLFHEIAHQLIHFDPDFKRAESTKQDRETDAEATAYVVCSHYHIESKDTPIYLAGFGANKDKILGRFNFIRKAAIEMFEGIDQVMSEMQLMQGKSSQEKEMEPDELPTVDRVPEQSLAMAGNLYGSLGLIKVARIGSMPFLYNLEIGQGEEDI